MIYSIIFIMLVALAYWYWRTRFVPAEVKLNDADITANGSQDDLRKGYHQRRVNVRALTLAALSAVASTPLWFAHWLAGLLGLLAVAILLGGYFIRHFTPLLNLARLAAGRKDITEYYASSDSASWPDAKIWKKVRADTAASVTSGPPDPQRYANQLLEKLLTRTHYACLAASAALAAGAAWVAMCAQ